MPLRMCLLRTTTRTRRRKMRQTQERAAERADVSRMEQALQHVRDEITKAVKALAAYARERLAQHRQAQLARERDDLGRSR